jgi:pimeloyl-[acyl-carrier protein] methyl ester esterase
VKSLHTETLGQGETIVLVHGWAMHSGIWRDFALKLAEHYQVILIDLPGHGQSEAIECFDLEYISCEIIKVVPDYPCCWLGWSLGATIVLDISQRFPERTSTLILLAGNPHFTQTENWPGMSYEFLQAFKLSISNNGEFALLRFLLLQLQGTNEAKALGVKLKQSFLQFKIPTKKTLLDGLDILRDADLRPALFAAKCPVVFILGAKDGLVPVSVEALIQKTRSASYLKIIEGAGHVPFLSHPQQVINVIQKVMN